MRKRHGFTMIELLVVLAVVAMLLSIVAPRYVRQVDKAKEAALRENLSAMRVALDQFNADKGRYPEQLQQLVQEHYLRSIPIDPVTGRRNTWQLVLQEGEGEKGIYDVRSGAAGKGRDNTAYGTW